VALPGEAAPAVIAAIPFPEGFVGIPQVMPERPPALLVLPHVAIDGLVTDREAATAPEPADTGTQLARELRELRPELPVVITTGYSETIDSESARDLGAAAYLAKPFGARELVKVLREVLPEGRA
jgi:CheY-like chemotaxis protein